MPTQYVQRLILLGNQLLDFSKGGNKTCVNTFKGNSRLKSDCEKVGLQMIARVNQELLKKTKEGITNIRKLNRENQKKEIIKIFNDYRSQIQNLPGASNINITSNLSDDILKITNTILDDLDNNPDKFEAVYRLIVLLNPDESKRGYNLNPDIKTEVYNLCVNIIQNKTDYPNHVNFNNIQYGGEPFTLGALLAIGILVGLAVGVAALFLGTAAVIEGYKKAKNYFTKKTPITPTPITPTPAATPAQLSNSRLGPWQNNNGKSQ
jgi:hypothetical protein